MADSEDKSATLVDALDVVVDKGAVLHGDVVIRIADLDMLAISLRVIIVSLSKLSSQQGERVDDVHVNELGDEVFLQKLERQIEEAQKHINQMINADVPEQVEGGLAQLVLTLIKLIVDLVEREAMRRVERDELTDMEVQKLGLNLEAIETKIEELRLVFGLEEDDLNIDLGSLGKLR
nr:gas vesicle protein GvpJ [uncultured Draconibacterium sp.]